jgi:hypothetical protein
MRSFDSPSKCPDRIEWFRGGGVELKMFYFKTTLAPRLKSSRSQHENALI